MIASIKAILKSDFCINEPRPTTAAPDRDWTNWLLTQGYDPDAVLVLSEYAQALQTVGIDLSNLHLIDVVTGHFGNLEDALLVTLANKDLEKPTVYLMAALCGRWKPRAKNPLMVPVKTAADLALPLQLPRPAPRRRITELQAELNKGGVRARVREFPEAAITNSQKVRP